MFKLLALDCDGVLTDGTKTLNRECRVISKKFNDKDWTAIKKFVACDIPVVVISGDPWNENIFLKRNIPFFCSKRGDGFLDKKQFIPILEKTYNVKSGDIAFCGDDFFDLDIMKLIGYPFCPKDANSDVIKFINDSVDNCFTNNPYILERNGGDGCIDSLFSVSVKNFGLEIPSFLNEKVRFLDSKEK